jgi:hypothetical protein
METISIERILSRIDKVPACVAQSSLLEFEKINKYICFWKFRLMSVI